MQKRRANCWNLEMWYMLEKDMGKLQEDLLEQNYGIAQSSLTTLELTARRNAELLGNAEAIEPSPLPSGDERRLLWNKAAQKLRQILLLLDGRDYGQAAEFMDAALNDVRIHTHEAIKAYNRERYQDPS